MVNKIQQTELKNFLQGNLFDPKRVLSDISIYPLLFSNILTLIFAFTENWSLVEIMFLYWAQSIIIGIVNFIRIITLGNFSVDNFQMNGKPLKANTNGKLAVSFFSCFIMGFFI